MESTAAERLGNQDPQPAAEVGTSLELFAGAGGLALGLESVGFRHLALSELEPRACTTLRTNRGDNDPDRWPVIEGDVRTLDLDDLAGEVDVVAGGPPCQPFSLGGVHRGHEDRRNLFPELIRVVRETRPRAVLCENVRGLLRPSFKPYFDYIISCLSLPTVRRRPQESWTEHDARLTRSLRRDSDPSSRYRVSVCPVNAADYGVPQVRQRVMIVAFRADLGIDWQIPEPSHSASALEASKATGDYWSHHDLVPPQGPYQSAIPIGDGRSRWRTLRDAIADLPTPVEGEEHPAFLHHVGWPGARIYPGHTPNDLDRPAKTVKAGVHGVPGGESVVTLDDGTHRYLTVREVARVMTFPDSWILAGPRSEQMRQLGNAVPPMLAAAFAQSIADKLRPHLRAT